MDYTIWLDELTKNSGNVAGGKGANLGELVSIGMPVPEGFAVTTKSFDTFIELNRIKEKIQQLIDSCDVDDTSKLLDTSERIKELIVNSEYPPSIKRAIKLAYDELSYSRDIKIPEALAIISAGREYAIVAVRSSATTEDLPTASFAGQQASFLNVKGVTNLFKSVKECWASLYTPRAIFYRAKKGFKHASISVIVQRMVNSDKAGVMFTINPSTNEDVVIIEASWGLGETLVLGEVQPDSYTVSKDGKIIEKRIGKKKVMRVRDRASDKTVEVNVSKEDIERQVLTEEKILDLAKYGIKIEAKSYREIEKWVDESTK